MSLVPRPKAVFLDLDGTVYEVESAIPGASIAVDALRKAGLPLRFITNTSRMSRRAVLQGLNGMGISAQLDELYTTGVAAASWLKSCGIERVSLLLPESALEDFSDLVVDDDRPQAVVVGDLGPAWSFEHLNRAFRAILNGAQLVATHRNRYWKTSDGLTLDAGAFVAALEYASGVEATLVGKPSSQFFQTAADSLEVSIRDVVMTGDDLQNDVAGIQQVGGRGVLVRTGKFRQEELDSSSVHPDAIVDSIADLPDLLL
ncbi:MAG: TIGR01458 family HAD-type hydrolase [Gemmatimonadales bacterium]